MSYHGIKRILGESSLERKIQILFAVCLLVLITGSFLWVNRITEEMIYLNAEQQAASLKSHYILRTHMASMDKLAKIPEQEQQAYATLYRTFSKAPSSIPYKAELFTLDDEVGRKDIHPQLATDREVWILSKLEEAGKRLQQQQNELQALNAFDQDALRARTEEIEANPIDFEKEELQAEFSEHTRQKFYYYMPLVFNFSSQCFNCHEPFGQTPEQQARLAEIRDRLVLAETTPEETRQLNQEREDMVPPLFLRITLDNAIAQSAITRSRAILISVAIVTAVLSVGMLWTIVRYVIVKPLAHLRDVTEEVRQGNMDVRAELNTGDEFEELSRSLNRMLRYMVDTQNQLREANQGLDQKVDEQAQLNLQLHEMNKIKSEFLANMSHELRTPLNSIIGFAELLENASGLNDKQTRFAANIGNSGRLLLDLINDILDLAKLEAGKMEVRPTEFSIGSLAQELVEMVRHLAETKNIQLELNVPADLPNVSQDRVKIQQILTNLLSNAVKFTPEGGRITVKIQRVEGDPDQLRIRVRDTGIGIAPADQLIVFEKFRQGPSALGNDALTREVSGTGLGLSIVKELCVLLGGSIELQSEVGQGSLFTVTVPWEYASQERISSQISDEINEITKSQRVDFARANLTPVPPPVEAD